MAFDENIINSLKSLDKKKAAEEAKEKGNACMKEKNYIEGMLHYTQAVKLQPNNASLYSNRCLAFKHMQQYYLALEDARKVIKLDNKWPKGYFRLGEVYFDTEHYQEALWWYKQALNMSPDDEMLKASVTKARHKLSEQTSAEKKLPMWGVAVGTAVGLAIVIGDQVMAKTSVLQYFILQALVVLALAGVGYGASMAYKYFLHSQRDGLLEEPVDLFPDAMPNNTESSGSAESSKTETKSRKRRSTAAARQQARQGHS